MKKYLYPQDLKAVAKLWLWSLKDFAVIGISLLLSVLLITQTGFAVPIALSLLYGFLTIRLEDTTILDFIRYATKYFLTSEQYFEWRLNDAKD
jgi:hypothetical protein